MSVTLSQTERRGRLTTVLGPDTVVLLRMDGEEELSGDFEWRVEALSDQDGIDLNALIGTHATIGIETEAETRQFDGIVCEAAHVGLTENGNRYDFVLRPWLHLATLRRNQRIFHDKTVVQIVEEVLQPYADNVGSPHLEVALTEDYPVLEYTVQYGESDADFCRRLMERFGITWSYRHEDGAHILRLTDHVDAHDLIAGEGGARPYRGVDRWHPGEEEHFREWHGGTRVTTGAVRLTEYNFKTPHAAQEVDRPSPTIEDRARMESFDWPGDYLDRGEGTGVVARRLEEERGQAPRHRAKGEVAGLGAGTLVDLTGDPIPGVTGERFICLKATHRFRSQAYGSGSPDDEQRGYDGAFVLLPTDAPFRPERRTKRPIIQGPQTAVVVGDGEIDCDEYGRILVRYHWDLKGAYSMRCRVSQNWASKGWGGMVIPRIGMEVIVEHLEGDPDKPIVTGCVYNGANMAPYELPANKTRSVFRSDSHQKTGFNEMTFEDKTGRENMFFHAEKDHTSRVLNDRTARVDRHDVYSVGGNRSVEVSRNQKTEVGGSSTTVVGGTGPMAIGALAGVAGLTGNTAGLLSQAGQIAGGGGAALAGFVGTLASTALGFFSGGGLGSRGGVVSGPNPRADAGTDLAASGTGVGEAASGLFPMSGIMNTVVEKFQSTSVGIAQVDQVGLSKVTNVGATEITNVGKEQRTTVGKTIRMEVGDLFDLYAKKTFLGRSKTWTIAATEKIVLTTPGGYIELNKRGIKLHGLRIDIEGNKINFTRGGPGHTESKDFAEECPEQKK
ncbi:type VI secretion system tip protein TssI/VgrG [Fulvimarina sp. MAC3]|uniref:type VI secretion system Vgr family protein n=1 Tax=Fulvimarina sp. MAC3 TaxID=3148887 RepID=UPI0031FD079C